MFVLFTCTVMFCCQDSEDTDGSDVMPQNDADEEETTEKGVDEYREDSSDEEVF